MGRRHRRAGRHGAGGDAAQPARSRTSAIRCSAFCVLASLVLLLVGLVVAFLAWLLPVKRHGLKLHWVTVWLSRQLLKLYAIDVKCSDAGAIRTLHGILYVNHITFLDIPVVVAVTPARFLSTAEVFRIPSWAGWRTRFKQPSWKRGDKASGEAVRKQIAAEVSKDPHPPFVIFPEGRFGTASSLRPFHVGSFAVAAQNSIPYLPCACAMSRPMWRSGRGRRRRVLRRRCGG